MSPQWIKEDTPRWDADNVVPDTHPDPSGMARWLTARGFVAGPADLRRRIRAGQSDK